jgi:hypothetical protein
VLNSLDSTEASRSNSNSTAVRLRKVAPRDTLHKAAVAARMAISCRQGPHLRLTPCMSTFKRWRGQMAGSRRWSFSRF